MAKKLKKEEPKKPVKKDWMDKEIDNLKKNILSKDKDTFVVEEKGNFKDLSSHGKVNDIKESEDKVVIFTDEHKSTIPPKNYILAGNIAETISPEESLRNIESMIQDYKNWHYDVLHAGGQTTQEEFIKTLSEKYEVKLVTNK